MIAERVGLLFVVIAGGCVAPPRPSAPPPTRSKPAVTTSPAHTKTPTTTVVYVERLVTVWLDGGASMETSARGREWRDGQRMRTETEAIGVVPAQTMLFDRDVGRARARARFG